MLVTTKLVHPRPGGACGHQAKDARLRADPARSVPSIGRRSRRAAFHRLRGPRRRNLLWAVSIVDRHGKCKGEVVRRLKLKEERWRLLKPHRERR